MHSRIFDIGQEYLELLHFLNDGTEGDIDQESFEMALSELKADYEEKLSNIGKIVVELEEDVHSIKKYIDKMHGRINRKNKRILYLKSIIRERMISADTKKISKPEIELVVRNNPPSIKVTDEEAIPKEFFNFNLVKKLDKNKVKEHISKTSNEVPGVTVESSKSLMVKCS